ncbi:hypothetical protein [Methylosinus sp. LW4]|uniref:hypothetical protein n=1 Tax=Methylosinus sp. LW4 TaxID=136993 RepID=UPI00036D60E3|nr:hypothetical protein [Methylosinus sp. LW4]
MTLIEWLGRMIAVRTFRDREVAAHSLRFGGSLAGVVDEVSAKRVRGWIYDAKRNEPVVLEILLDGEVVQRTKANLYRDDIAERVGGNGLHGFDCEVAAFATPSAKMRSVQVRVADRPQYQLGTFDLEPNRSPLEMPSPDVPQALHDRLQHIFSHITAAHEHSLRRFDAIQASFDRLQSTPRVASTSGGGGESDGASLLYQYPRSAISGVGQFRLPLTDDIETTLFQARLEVDLMKERHFS